MIKKLKISCQRFYIKWIPPVIAQIAKGVMHTLMFTCRVEVIGIDQFISIADKERCILMLWHNRLAIIANILHKNAPQYIYAAFISNSRDGELLTALVHSYPQGKTLRVPHQKKHLALRELIKQLRAGQEIMLMTPDGPRGPKYRIKQGVALAAKSAQAKIIPLTWSADRFWQLNTWDNMILPKPFAKIVVEFGKPVEVSDEENHDLEDKLNQLNEQVCGQITTEKSRWPT